MTIEGWLFMPASLLAGQGPEVSRGESWQEVLEVRNFAEARILIFGNKVDYCWSDQEEATEGRVVLRGSDSTVGRH